MSGSSAASIDVRVGVVDRSRRQPLARVGVVAGELGGQRLVGEPALDRRPEDVLRPVRDRELVELERVVDVEDRRVRLEQADRPLLRIEPVLVDAGDERLLLRQLGLTLDDRGEGQDLVEVHAAVLRHRHPLGADVGGELVEHQPHELVGRRVRQDAIGRRPQEPLERCALRRVVEDRLEPRVVGEESRRRVLDDVVELRRVHLQRQRLELGGDLLEAQARPQADVDVLDRRRREQRVDQLIRRHVLAQHERALLERAGQLVDRGDEHERPAVTEQALVLEPCRDAQRRVARLDQELDLGGIGRGRGRQGGTQVLADDVLRRTAG